MKPEGRTNDIRLPCCNRVANDDEPGRTALVLCGFCGSILAYNGAGKLMPVSAADCAGLVEPETVPTVMLMRYLVRWRNASGYRL